jgi:hypothetical protein
MVKTAICQNYGFQYSNADTTKTLLLFIMEDAGVALSFEDLLNSQVTDEERAYVESIAYDINFVVKAHAYDFPAISHGIAFCEESQGTVSYQSTSNASIEDMAYVNLGGMFYRQPGLARLITTEVFDHNDVSFIWLYYNLKGTFKVPRKAAREGKIFSSDEHRDQEYLYQSYLIVNVAGESALPTDAVIQVTTMTVRFNKIESVALKGKNFLSLVN